MPDAPIYFHVQYLEYDAHPDDREARSYGYVRAGDIIEAAEKARAGREDAEVVRLTRTWWTDEMFEREREQPDDAPFL